MNSTTKKFTARMGKELRLSLTLRRRCHYPWLFNFVVRKANENQPVQEFLVDALAHVDSEKILGEPVLL